ncbi:MAG: class I SAM-dependent methyltransferase [Anaerolineales bacterium]
MHEKRFSGDIERLRSAERVARLEVETVIQLCLEGGGFKRILDVGTGSGLFAEGYSKQGLEVTGIDANPNMPLTARKYIPNGRFLQATAEALPFATGAFDLAFYGLVLHEADDALKVLKAARRVTRKRICVLEWPYREQTYGPAMEHRLSPTKLELLFKLADFDSWNQIQLTNTVLYRLDGGNLV